MKLGITGTREGMTDYQAEEVYKVLCQFRGFEFHHGDCVGVDCEAAHFARALGYIIVCHPPKSTEKQGFFGGDEMRKPTGYLQRDRAIVDECDILLVVPLQMTWQPRGGTWYTHDYAKQKNKPVNIIWPQLNE